MSYPEDEDDGALFRAAIGEVTPLPATAAPANAKP
ncbi:SMR domain protein, partial [Xanthomonas sp. Kuri4-1]